MAFNWYKEGARVLATPRIQIRGAVMEITDVTYEDSGVYVCVLRGHKESMRNFTITVAGEEINAAKFTHCFKNNLISAWTTRCLNCNGPELNVYHTGFVTFPDSLGSGDDDEDNGLEDSSTEVENDQVYLSRGA